MKFSYHKTSHPYKRRVHLDKAIFSWRIAGYKVYIRNSTRTVTCLTDIYELNKTTIKEWEGSCSGYPRYIDPECIMQPAVTPQLVKDFIFKHKNDFEFKNTSSNKNK